MKLRDYICVLAFAALLCATAVAQDDSGQQPPDSSQQPSSSQPAPAFGQTGPTPAQNVDNPPISGLDLPNLNPNASSRSFLVPGIHVSQAIDTNIGSQLGGQQAVQGVTRALGSLALQKLWNRYDVGLQYVGGGAYYGGQNIGWTQFHSLDADQRYLWRTGQFALRDSFSYLPEGAFGYGAYGGSGALGGVGGLGGAGGGIGGIGVGGGSGVLLGGAGALGSLGSSPRIGNVTIADITQSVTPRSSITLAGSYGLLHFINDQNFAVVNGIPVMFFNSQQVSAQAGYNYQINRSDQIGVLYAYQSFHFPTSLSGDFRTHVFHLLYGHRISGRMDLVLGGGPQITDINSISGMTSNVSASGQALLRYRFTNASMTASYNHYNSSGSGFYGGAKTNLFRLTASRPFGRNWSGTADFGYTNNSRILPQVSGGVGGESFNYWYAGGSLHRQFGREFSGFVSYLFNDLGFDSTFCGGAPSCSRVSRRQVALIGIDWTPHPIRLD